MEKYHSNIRKRLNDNLFTIKIQPLLNYLSFIEYLKLTEDFYNSFNS